MQIRRSSTSEEPSDYLPQLLTEELPTLEKLPALEKPPELPQDVLKTILLHSKGHEVFYVPQVCTFWNTCYREIYNNFFALTPHILGAAYFQKLCSEILQDKLLTKPPQTLQLLMFLAAEQRKKVEATLLYPEDIEHYYQDKDPLNANFFLETEKMLLMHNVQLCLESEQLANEFQRMPVLENSTFFIDTQKWLADFNLICMGSHLITSDIGNKIKSHVKMALNNRNFAIGLHADTLRNYVKTEKDEGALHQQFLDLINVGLTEVPPEITLFEDLISLDLGGNYLTFPQHIEHLTKLVCLELSKNRISPRWTFPKIDSVDTYSSIKTLGLAQNALNQIPKIVYQLPSLETLNLSANCISYLPSSIANLTLLKRLFLDKNALWKLPEEIGSLNLTTLNLGSNHLSHLPESFNKLVNLSNLNLSKNRFKKFPMILLNNRRLSTLDISNNPLSDIPVELFSTLKTLTISNSQEKLLPSTEERGTVQIILKKDFYQKDPSNLQ